MFVRTKKGKIFDCIVHEQMGKPIYYPKTSETNGYIDWNEVYKKSENIIDILEEGDYVNGERVIKHFTTWLALGIAIVKEQDIKSIVTKEQIESLSYKVGD